MATDYDAPRKTDEELAEDSLEELKARRADKAASAVDVDEAKAAAKYDNGVLTLAIRRAGLEWAREIPLPPGAAATFHGRDAFAPYARELVAARAGGPGEGSAAGIPPPGPAIEPVLLDWPEPRHRDDGAIEGEVVHVDAFGNLVTNIPAGAVALMGTGVVISVGGAQVPDMVGTYADVPARTLCAMAGSTGRLEVAVNGGSTVQVTALHETAAADLSSISGNGAILARSDDDVTFTGNLGVASLDITAGTFGAALSIVGGKAMLDLRVRTQRGWRDDPALLDRLGP